MTRRPPLLLHATVRGWLEQSGALSALPDAPVVRPEAPRLRRPASTRRLARALGVPRRALDRP